jgi:hypothetical protein
MLSTFITLLTSDSIAYTVRSNQPLQAGQLLLFLPSNTVGSVLNRLPDTDTYLVATDTPPDKLDRLVTFYSWWKQQQPNSSARLVAVEFFSKGLDNSPAILKASPYSLPTDAQPGSLGWDFWYKLDPSQPWLHILKGNDLTESGCFFTQPSAQWPSGFWLFKATLFYKTNLIPLARGQHYFETTKPCSSFNFKFKLS